MNKKKKKVFGLSIKESTFVTGILMMVLALVNYYLFEQDWLAVCMFGIGGLGCILSLFTKDN